MLIVNLINLIIHCGFIGTAITSIHNESSVIMTVRHNNRKYQQQQQQKGLKTASILSSETILNENLLTNQNSFEKNYINRNDNSIISNNNNKNNNNLSSNNRNRNSRLNNSNTSSSSSNKRITIMSMPQKIIKIISIVTGSGGGGVYGGRSNNTSNKVLIKHYNDGKRIYDYGSNDEYSRRNNGGNNNIIIRGTREVTNSDMDENGWTNINEEVDLTIPLVLSHLQELGMTDFKLPDMEETISLKPLFITYSAGLLLYNGAFYNIEGIYRNGDAMMTYHDKAFQFRLNLIIRKLQFDYDFSVKVMGLSAATGTVVGTLEDLLITGDFSVDIRDPIIKLNDFQIVKFGNIIVQLNHNRIVQELSGMILTPITNLFRDRITTGITDDMKQQLSELIAEFSRKDELGIKKFMSQILSSITRQ